MRTIHLVFVIAAIGTSVGANDMIGEAKETLRTAQRLETSRVMEAGVPSAAGNSFIRILASQEATESFEEVARTAKTSAGKAYAIIGLYQVNRVRAVALLNELSADFRVSVMWYDLKYEWNREEFARQVKDKRFVDALLQPVNR